MNKNIHMNTKFMQYVWAAAVPLQEPWPSVARKQGLLTWQSCLILLVLLHLMPFVRPSSFSRAMPPQAKRYYGAQKIPRSMAHAPPRARSTCPACLPARFGTDPCGSICIAAHKRPDKIPHPLKTQAQLPTMGWNSRKYFQ